MIFQRNRRFSFLPLSSEVAHRRHLSIPLPPSIFRGPKDPLFGILPKRNYQEGSYLLRYQPLETFWCPAFPRWGVLLGVRALQGISRAAGRPPPQGGRSARPGDVRAPPTGGARTMGMARWLWTLRLPRLWPGVAYCNGLPLPDSATRRHRAPQGEPYQSGPFTRTLILRALSGLPGLPSFHPSGWRSPLLWRSHGCS